jgi:hypothetical protein
MLACDRRAHCVRTLDLASDQRQDKVQIVDHQIEDHRDIGATLFERRDTRGFQIERRAEPGFHGTERSGEALQVPHLQHQLGLRRERRQFVGLRKRRGDRLFHQHMPAGTQRLHAERMVHLGRRGNHQCIACAEQCRKIQSGSVGFPAYGLCPLGVGIENASKHRPLGCGNLQRMIAPEVADACNADAKPGRCHRKLQSLLVMAGVK